MWWKPSLEEINPTERLSSSQLSHYPFSVRWPLLHQKKVSTGFCKLFFTVVPTEPSSVGPPGVMPKQHFIITPSKVFPRLNNSPVSRESSHKALAYLMHHMAIPNHALLQTRILLNTSTNEGPLVNKLKKKKNCSCCSWMPPMTSNAG